jgi:ABC-type dipeptide/oligopeptide/nickel transport system permease subunit
VAEAMLQTKLGTQQDAVRSRSPWMEFSLRMLRRPDALMCLAVIIILLLCAMFAQYLAPYPEDKQNLGAVEQAPSALHWFGTDQLGRDTFSRVIFGSRMIVFLIVISTLLDLIIGIPIGALAGYYRGWVDTVIMRFADLLFAFPDLLLIYLIAATVKPAVLDYARSIGLNELARSGYIDWTVTIVALSLIGWAGIARLVRGQVLSVREREFVLSAQSTGVPTWTLIRRHVLPNALTPLIVTMSSGMGFTALAGVTLGYLGIGPPPGTANWGSILVENLRFWRLFPQMIWMLGIPGIIIAVVVFAFIFLGDALNEELNPQTRRVISEK